MIFGILYIIAGILLVLFPQLLAFMVAFIFIVTGISMMYMSYYYKRTSHRFNDSYIDFMFRL
jgi:Flp pilus assembly protein TadB